MSVSNILGKDGKIVEGVLPNPYPFPATAGLGAVLAVNNSANDPITGQPLSIFDVSTMSASLITAPFGTIQALGADLIEDAGGLGNTAIIPNNNLSLLPQNNIIIKGAQTKGSLLVGDGTSTKELIVPVAPALPNGSVLILDSTTALGVRWGGESGDINSITPGNNIDITGPTANPIVAVRNPLNATLNLGSQNVSGGLGLATPNSVWNYQGLNFFTGGPGGGPVEGQYLPNSISLTTPLTNSGSVAIQPTSMAIQGPSTSTPTSTIITPTLTTIQVINGPTTETAKTTLTPNAIATSYENTTTPAPTLISNVNSNVVSTGATTTLNYSDTGVASTSFANSISANNASTQVIVQDLTPTPNPAGASYTMGLSTATIGAPTANLQLGVSTPTTSPFPNIDANATLSVSTTNPSL